MRTRSGMKRTSKTLSTPSDYSSVRNNVKDADDFKPEVKVVLYGKPGTGKTTIASTFPKPCLLIDIREKGSDSVRTTKGLKVIRVTTWDELEMLYWYLKDNPDKLKSVVFDTVSNAQELAVKYHLDSKGQAVDAGRIGNWGTMKKQDWGEVASMIKTLIMNVRELPLDMAFIAHDRVFNSGEEDDEADGITPSVGPRLMPSVASTLNAAVGVIGNTFIRERYKTVGTGKEKKEVRKVEYCLRIGPHSYYITKVRKPKSELLPDLLINPEYEDILELIMSGEE